METKCKLTMKLIFTCSWAERQGGIWLLHFGRSTVFLCSMCWTNQQREQNQRVVPPRPYRSSFGLCLPHRAVQDLSSSSHVCYGLGGGICLGHPTLTHGKPIFHPSHPAELAQLEMQPPKPCPREMAASPPWSPVLSSQRISREETNHQWHL